ncbi:MULTISPECIES: ABC transporter ATP-binding protein [unclassified Beijerinckia]|uniref:ABC transporter ATP-binding protein n=1 Tax=unclassified Beijerinckia TaxID=2638183 RepID=UPI00089AA0F8|nr:MULTISPECIES: ABC transporter ATP-binding protein [unclassified Beijerinckia]MDH7796971.1 branched-chain amino acid transport system ATP-binding protein [Beijerinckia sp. GAS462]SEC67085.1 amino acid/amide ABC transporter ATP-binding protein 2, HAAT family [Beijerinckia sp. 28-YEA-48]
MLDIANLHAAYGHIKVLNGVTFQVPAGSIATILGRNGSGRSSTCKAVMGLLPPSRGTVKLKGRDLAGMPAHQIAHAGVGYVPEDRQIFRNLTVDENMTIGAKAGVSPRPAWTRDELYDVFPRLRERRNIKAGFLSGGEQQMLTLFRSLLGNPDVMLIDEPTEGLAPKVIDALAEAILEMKRRGLAILLLEQKLSMVMRLTDKVFVMGRGEIVFSGSVAEFQDDDVVRSTWLEVS